MKISDRRLLARVHATTLHFLDQVGMLNERDKKWLEDIVKKIERLFDVNLLTQHDIGWIREVEARLHEMPYPRGNVFANEIASYRSHLETLSDRASKMSLLALLLGGAGLLTIMGGSSFWIDGKMTKVQDDVKRAQENVTQEITRLQKEAESRTREAIAGLDDAVAQASKSASAEAKAQVLEKMDFFQLTADAEAALKQQFAAEVREQVGNALNISLSLQKLLLEDQFAHPERYEGRGLLPEYVTNLHLILDELHQRYASTGVQALSSDQRESLSRTILGITNLCSREIEQARRCFRQAEQLDKKNFSAYRLQIVTEMMANAIADPTASTSNVNLVKEISNRFAEAANWDNSYLAGFSKGLANLTSGNYEDALRNYTLALDKLRESYPSSVTQRVKAAIEYQVAMVWFRKANELVLDSCFHLPPWIGYPVVCASYDMGEPYRKEAMAALQRAVKQGDPRPEENGDSTFLLAHNRIVWELTHCYSTELRRIDAQSAEANLIRTHLRFLERHPPCAAGEVNRALVEANPVWYSGNLIDTLMDAHFALEDSENGKRYAGRLVDIYAFIERPDSDADKKVKKRLDWASKRVKQ